MHKSHWRQLATQTLLSVWAVCVAIQHACQQVAVATAAGTSRARHGLASVFVISVLTFAFAGPFVSVAASPVVEPSKSDPVVIAAPAKAKKPRATFQAVVTQYSRRDSCHTIKNGKCIMASGRAVYVGAVACPAFLGLGTRVTIEGQTYTCEDRYSAWLDDQRGHPTVDIFVDANPHGNQVKLVAVE